MSKHFHRGMFIDTYICKHTHIYTYITMNLNVILQQEYGDKSMFAIRK